MSGLSMSSSSISSTQQVATAAELVTAGAIDHGHDVEREFGLAAHLASSQKLEMV